MQRRLCALVVVIALLATIPVGAPRGCVECPPGCPMHARAEADDHGARKRQPGCHRAPAPPSGAVCLRSACGRDALTASSLLPDAVLGATAERSHPVAELRLVTPEPRLASRPAPEPALEPPRSVLG
jgi:hypothetical protein